MSKVFDLVLGVFREPGLVADLRDRELPDSLSLVIRLAAGEGAALQCAVDATGEPEETLVDACVFFLQQVLFAPGADAYRVLGADSDAPQERLRDNYRWLMKWLHPDRNQDGWEAVYADRVNIAWQDLKTPDRRAEYDRRVPSSQMLAPLSAAPMRRAVPVAATPGGPLLSGSTVRRLPTLVLGTLGVAAAAMIGITYWAQSETQRELSELRRDRDAPAAVAAARPDPGLQPATADDPSATSAAAAAVRADLDAIDVAFADAAPKAPVAGASASDPAVAVATVPPAEPVVTPPAPEPAAVAAAESAPVAIVAEPETAPMTLPATEVPAASVAVVTVAAPPTPPTLIPDEPVAAITVAQPVAAATEPAPTPIPVTTAPPPAIAATPSPAPAIPPPKPAPAPIVAKPDPVPAASAPALAATPAIPLREPTPAVAVPVTSTPTVAAPTLAAATAPTTEALPRKRPTAPAAAAPTPLPKPVAPVVAAKPPAQIPAPAVAATSVERSPSPAPSLPAAAVAKPATPATAAAPTTRATAVPQPGTSTAVAARAPAPAVPAVPAAAVAKAPTPAAPAPAVATVALPAPPKAAPTPAVATVAAPAPPRPAPAQHDAEALVREFASAYAAGDLARFDRLFTSPSPEVSALVPMRSRFASTEMRYLEIQQIGWHAEAEQGRVRARFRDTYVPRGGRKAVTESGEIEWTIRVDAGDARIASVVSRK